MGESVYKWKLIIPHVGLIDWLGEQNIFPIIRDYVIFTSIMLEFYKQKNTKKFLS